VFLSDKVKNGHYNWACGSCGHTTRSSVTRMIHHLGQMKGKGISGCPNPTPKALEVATIALAKLGSRNDEREKERQKNLERVGAAVSHDIYPLFKRSEETCSTSSYAPSSIQVHDVDDDVDTSSRSGIAKYQVSQLNICTSF
jgi:hypothetical protein